MYYNPRHPPIPIYPPAYVINHFPISRTYPPVDVKVFSHSVKSFRLLMEQGNILLDRLGDANFAYKVMTAAQHGEKAVVDQLIKTIGLNVPVTTKYTPTGVNFELTTQTTHNIPVNCCTLKIAMKWGD